MNEYGPAINQLKASLDVMRNNEPINRAEGHKAQADLEKANGESFRRAIEVLKNSPTMKRLKHRKV